MVKGLKLDDLYGGKPSCVVLTAQGRSVYKVVRTDDEDWPYQVYACNHANDELTKSMQVFRIGVNMTETQFKLQAMPGKELVAQLNLKIPVGKMDPRVAQVGGGADLALVLSILSIVQSWTQ